MIGKSQFSSRIARPLPKFTAPATSNRIAKSNANLNRRGNGNGNGNGNHHHHCRTKFFFIGGFGYPFYWWDYPFYGWYAYPPNDYYYEQQGAYQAESYAGDSVVAQVQNHLARSGYYHGAIDGVAGPATERAIRAFERDHHLRVDGAIDDQLLEKMNLL
jgi:hypothetical protein